MLDKQQINLSLNLSIRHRWLNKFRKHCEAKGCVWHEGQWARPGGLTSGAVIFPRNVTKKDVILFFHGYGNDAFYPHVGPFRFFLSQGFIIATCDLDGHGHGNQSLLDSRTAFSAVSGLMNFVDVNLPTQPKFHLIGYSLGAALMFAFLGKNTSDRVKTIAMISMPLRLPDKIPVRAELSSFLSRDFRNALKDYGVYGVWPAISWFKRSVYPVRFADQTSLPALTKLAVFFDELDFEASLRKIVIPCLYLTGERDYIAPAKAISATICKPYGPLELIELQGATHFSCLLSESCWHSLDQFVQKHST